MRCVIAWVALSFVAASANAADSKPQVAVLDFAANGASKELASAVAGVAANELDRLGAFKVITTEAIRQMLALEKQRQMLGGSCTDQSCLAEIGGALGVDYLLAGKVSRIAGSNGKATFSVEMTLSNVKKAQRESSDVGNAPSEAELMGYIPKAVSRTFAKLLADRAGKLILTTQDRGALVAIDDVVKGTTPLRTHLTLPAGPHRLRVSKDGFVTHEQEIQIAPNVALDERVTLVPSPDFIGRYETRARKMRLGAWITTGLAGAGALTFIGFQMRAGSAYGSESTPGTFLFHRARVEEDAANRKAAETLKSRVDTSEIISYVGAGVGAAAAASAVYLWISGDPPGRYARFKDTSAAIVPTKDGAVGSVAIAF